MQNRRLPTEAHCSLAEIAIIVLQSHWLSHIWSYFYRMRNIFLCILSGDAAVELEMGTQMSSARRGIATEEMKQVAKDEDIDLNFLVQRVANGSIIIPKNNSRKQKIKVVGIGHGLKTKVNVNIGTSTLYQNLAEEISKARVAVKYGADTIMDLSDGGDINLIREKLLEAAPITFGTVPVYQAYAYGVEKFKNPLNITDDDFLNAFEKNVKDGVD
jgi:phosphomethylpyrimidine synthase